VRTDDLPALAKRLSTEWPPSPELLETIGAQPAPESTHTVFRIAVDGEPCALKVFRSWERGEPDREWTLLGLLDGTGLAPRPVWRSPTGMRPIIASTWVPGTPLRQDAPLSREVVDRILAAHEIVHSLPAPPGLAPAISSGANTAARILGWWHELPSMAALLRLSRAVRDRVEGEPFASSRAVAGQLARPPVVVTRGDTNLANYLTHGAELRVIDFEDAGLGEPLFELADMLEHFANRSAIPEWPHDDDLWTARGLVAEFWFALTIRRKARGLAMTPPISPDQQLARLVELGATPS